MAKIFVSYTSKDKDWAFWLAQELEKLGHVPHVHEWEIPAGGNIVQWMRQRVDDSEHMACLVSCEYLTKVYSGWELESGLWAAISTRKNFVLPIFVEACEPPRLLALFKRCDLYGLIEEDARGRLAEYMSSGVRPPGPMRFPGGAKPASLSPERTAPVTFPGVRKPSNLPFTSLGDLFKGREEKLGELRAALETAKGAGVLVRALHGLGGVGKTRLAIEYAWAHEAEYSALLFVRAENAAALSASLAALAGVSVLDLPEKDTREDEVKFEAVLRWLEANPTWLLILDNVDDPDAVKAVTRLMPRLKGGHVVVTARAANFPPNIRKLELDVLDEHAAAAFLLQRTADDRDKAKDDEAQARALARELGGLALGLEQAGAQIATDHIGFQRYLELWSENRDAALAWNDPTLTGSDRTLATTWATSVARLKPESRRLLDRLAFVAPDPIPDFLLDVAVPGEAEDYDALKARAGLFAYSLATRAKGEDLGFVIHRLVQDFDRRAMTGERRTQALGEALGWVSAAFDGDPQDASTWANFDPLAPHVLAVARAAADAEILDLTGWLFYQLGSLLIAKARCKEAEPLMRRALEITESRRNRDEVAIASCVGGLAFIFAETNRLAEAEKLSRRALTIDEATFGPRHPKVAIRLSNMAEVLCETNRLDEAEQHMLRALVIDEECFGPNHPNVGIRTNNIAGIYQARNRLPEAEQNYRRALAIFEHSYGSSHPRVAVTLNNLASVRQGTDLEEAEVLYRRSLAIDEAYYGPEHPNVAVRLSNLATVLKQAGRTDEPEPILRRALEIDEASYGPDHPKVAFRLANLAALLTATHRQAEAEPSFRRALKIFEDSLGADHPNTATVRENLAVLEAALGKGP